MVEVAAAAEVLEVPEALEARVVVVVLQEVVEEAPPCRLKAVVHGKEADRARTLAVDATTVVEPLFPTNRVNHPAPALPRSSSAWVLRVLHSGLASGFTAPISIRTRTRTGFTMPRAR